MHPQVTPQCIYAQNKLKLEYPSHSQHPTVNKQAKKALQEHCSGQKLAFGHTVASLAHHNVS